MYKTLLGFYAINYNLWAVTLLPECEKPLLNHANVTHFTFPTLLTYKKNGREKLFGLPNGIL